MSLNGQERKYQQIKRAPANVRFEEICELAELFGFRFRGGKGSHRIFVRSGIREMLISKLKER
jgi:predicted RNA binding protein YcfA (HicA-like mRNA interferase family)